MNSPSWLLCWIAAGFFMCIWEVPRVSLGMPSTSDGVVVDGGKWGFLKVDMEQVDGEEVDGEEVDGEQVDGEEVDGEEVDGDEVDGEEVDGDEVDGEEVDGEEVDGEEVDGGEEDGGEEDGGEDNGEGDCIPPTNSSAPVGLRGYRRYFANDSLIGRPVPCTREDKICFRHNLIFNPITDRCEPLWSTCGEGDGDLIVNRTELEDGPGRVVSSCPDYDWKCSGYRMAYDGVCYQKETVRDVICGCNATRTLHILGGVECRVRPMAPISEQQPEEDGSCVIPDFRNPDPRRSMLLDENLQQLRKELNCRPDQAACFSKGKIFVLGFDGCHTLRKQGPCAEDHVVALDLRAATEGRAEGSCVHVRGGCPKGYKRMAFDGECHENREIKIQAPGKIVLDEFGRYYIIKGVEDVLFNAEFDGNQSCAIQIVNLRGVIQVSLVQTYTLSRPCGTDDSGKCSRVEVLNTPPKPIL